MSKRLFKYFFSFLHVDYVKLDQHWNYNNVLSPYYRLYYIDEGEGSILGNLGKVDLEPGYMYIIPSYTLCNLNCRDYLSQYYIHFFEESPHGISLFQKDRIVKKIKADEMDIANFKRMLQINPGRGINRSNDPKVYEKYVFYKGYEEHNNMQNISVFVETQGIIMQLLSKFLSGWRFSEKDSTTLPSKIIDAIGYIQMNLKENLTIAFLAKRANQDEDYFSKLFLNHTGLRPISFIHEKRIERAQYLITTTDMSYAQIAEETGFENLPYFSRIFKKVTGITPGSYRKQNHFS
jgi:AraC-like DNA-binding protein